MKALTKYNYLLVLSLFIQSLLLSQSTNFESFENMDTSNIELCYLNVSSIGKLPFIKVKGFKNNLISEELVFLYDIDMKFQMEEIQEGCYVEYCVTNDLQIKNIEELEFAVVPLKQLNKALGLNFFGIIALD